MVAAVKHKRKPSTKAAAVTADMASDAKSRKVKKGSKKMQSKVK
jgi:hypothetical protein